MKKIFKKKIISDLPTLIFSRYETGTTGIFLRLAIKRTKKFACSALVVRYHKSIFCLHIHSIDEKFEK
jgi:hypothetical protein